MNHEIYVCQEFALNLSVTFIRNNPKLQITPTENAAVNINKYINQFDLDDQEEYWEKIEGGQR